MDDNNDKLYSLSVREQSLIKHAIKAARKSDYRIKHGALLVKNGNILSIGFNRMRSTPLCAQLNKKTLCNSLHAEMDALQGYTYSETKDLDLYVIRVKVDVKTQDLFLGNSKPCSLCSQLISFHGLRNVIYSIEDRSLEMKDSFKKGVYV